MNFTWPYFSTEMTTVAFRHMHTRQLMNCFNCRLSILFLKLIVCRQKIHYSVGYDFNSINEIITFESRAIKVFIDYTLLNFDDLQMSISNPSNNNVVVLDNKNINHTVTPDYWGLRRSIQTISINVRPDRATSSGPNERWFVVTW